MSVGDAAAALVVVFERGGVRWYVFGAQAVVLHGVARTTQDIDVTVLVPAAGATVLAQDLAAGGFVHRFPDRSAELIAIAAVIPMTHATSGVDVDIVLAGSGLEELACSAAESRLLDGVRVPVVTVSHLAVMKVLAGRPKDLEDVRGLLAAGGVDRAEVLDLLGQLEEALGQSDLVPLFEELGRRR